jgi:hypothetical protein
MNARSPWFLCLAIALAVIPARISAQEAPGRPTLEDKISQSHRLDPDKFGLRGLDPEQLFREGLNKIRAREILENYKNNTGNKTIKIDDLIRDNRDYVEKVLKGFKFKELPQELKDRFKGQEKEIEDFIRKLQPEDLQKHTAAAQGTDSAAVPGESKDNSRGDTPGSSSEAGSAQRTEQKSTESAKDQSLSGSEPGDPKANSLLGRWLLKAADRFKDLEPTLRNSPALQKALRELSRKVEGGDERWKELDKGANAMAEKWARLGQALPLDRLLPAQGFSWPRSLTPRSWPNWSLPQTGPHFRRTQPTNVPHPGLPEMTERDGWRAFWMLVLLAALALVVWKALSRSRAADLLAGADVWKLGPWPVQPAAVGTREELIRAFEYLSLLQLGPAARSWHHRAIASSLGRSSDRVLSGQPDGWTQRRQAAEQLATFYERARYAPPDEPLPDAALAAARQDLCLLAGVPAS